MRLWTDAAMSTGSGFIIGWLFSSTRRLATDMLLSAHAQRTLGARPNEDGIARLGLLSSARADSKARKSSPWIPLASGLRPTSAPIPEGAWREPPPPVGVGEKLRASDEWIWNQADERPGGFGCAIGAAVVLPWPTLHRSRHRPGAIVLPESAILLGAPAAAQAEGISYQTAACSSSWRSPWRSLKDQDAPWVCGTR